MREKITDLLRNVGAHYRTRGVVCESDISQGHDVHAFYRLSRDPRQIIHVQGYTGMSSPNEARILARLMNYDLMMRARMATPRVSPGNEHIAVVKRFSNFNSGINVLYDGVLLRAALEENVPELRE